MNININNMVKMKIFYVLSIICVCFNIGYANDSDGRTDDYRVATFSDLTVKADRDLLKAFATIRINSFSKLDDISGMSIVDIYNDVGKDTFDITFSTETAEKGGGVKVKMTHDGREVPGKVIMENSNPWGAKREGDFLPCRVQIQKQESSEKKSYDVNIDVLKKDRAIEDTINTRTPELQVVPGKWQDNYFVIELKNIYSDTIKIKEVRCDKYTNVIHSPQDLHKGESQQISVSLKNEIYGKGGKLKDAIYVMYQIGNDNFTGTISIDIDVFNVNLPVRAIASESTQGVLTGETKKTPSCGANVQDIKVVPVIDMTSPNSGTYTLSIENISKDKITITDVTSSADCIKPCNTAMYAILFANEERKFKFNLNVPPTDCDVKISISYKIGDSGEIKTVSVPAIKFIHHEEVASGNNKEITSGGGNNYSWGWYVVEGAVAVVVVIFGRYVVKYCNRPKEYNPALGWEEHGWNHPVQPILYDPDNPNG